MGTTYIDLASLGPTEDLARLRIQLLNLSGTILRRQDRDMALRSLSPGDAIVTLPSSFPFWRRLPPTIPIVYADDLSAEDPPSNRVSSWLSWSLTQLGLSAAEANVLEKSPPKTERHGRWATWQTATEMAEAYDHMAGGSLPSTLETIGNERKASDERPYGWQLVSGDPLDADVALSLYSSVLGIDVETVVEGADPDETRDTLVGIGIAVGSNCFYGEASNDRWMEMLRAVLPQHKWTGHNAKYDQGILLRHGITPGPLHGDGMLAAKLAGEPSAGLKDLVLRHYGVRMTTYADVTLGGKRGIRDVPPEETAEYCCADAWYAVEIERDIRAKLPPQALRLYENTDVPLVNTIVNMELRGIKLDVESASAALAETTETLTKLAEAINALAVASGHTCPPTRRVCPSCHNGKNKKADCDNCHGEGQFFYTNPLNPGSTKQLVEWLHGHLRIPVQAISRQTGQASVDSLALLRMQQAHPAIPIILRHRQLNRYREFIEDWLKEADDMARIHSNFTMAFIPAGRLSSRDPNLQQVSEMWRVHFVAADGCQLVAADHAQVEVRTAAHASRDPGLLAVVNADPDTLAGDVHSQTVLRVFNVPYDEQKLAVNKHFRVRAKNNIFGAFFGSLGLEVQAVLEKAFLKNPDLGIPPTLGETARGIADIHDAYPHYFREWVPFMIERARDQGNTAYTCFGRPRVIPDLASGHKEKREAAERACISQIIQGTAADIIRMGMNLVEKLTGGSLLLSIHDELISEVDEGGLDKYIPSMVGLMQLDQPLDGVPLVVTAGVGHSWYDVK